MGKRSPGPMSYIREASALRNIKLCYAGRSFSIRVVIRCLPFILTTGRDEILALLTGLPLALKTGATISCFSSIKKSSCTESYVFSIGGLVDRA